MKRALLIAAIVFLASSAYSAEESSPKQIEEQLQRIEERKQAVQGDFERGRLLMENAQLKYRLLTAQEETLRAKLKTKDSK